jgi:hypothetical protein
MKQVVITGTLTVTYFDEALFREFAERQAAETTERKAFLEKYTGLPVEVRDDWSED